MSTWHQGIIQLEEGLFFLLCEFIVTCNDSDDEASKSWSWTWTQTTQLTTVWPVLDETADISAIKKGPPLFCLGFACERESYSQETVVNNDIPCSLSYTLANTCRQERKKGWECTSGLGPRQQGLLIWPPVHNLHNSLWSYHQNETTMAERK